MIMALLGLLTIFVETMLVPALPDIAMNLATPISDLAWVLTAYTLAGAVSIPIIGKMGEMWGRKRILLVIMAVYVVGLMGAAVSWDLLSLVLFLLPNAIMQLIFSPLGGRHGQQIGHGKIMIIGFAIAAVSLLTLSTFRGSEVGVLLTMSVFGIGIGLAMVGQTNMISTACSKDVFGSASAVNSMILTIGMSTGPVIASIIIGEFVDASGYAYCWEAAAVLAIMAITFVLLNKAELGTEAVSSEPREEHI